jgi:hypothetical protein
MDLLNPKSVIELLESKLTALQLPESFGSEVKAFEKVKVFDLQDVQKAFEELFLYGNRIAILAVDVVRHQNEISGRNLNVTRTMDAIVLFTDRRYADRVLALMGDDQKPGILLLEKLLVDELTGELSNGAVVLPGTGELVALQDDKRKDLTGRIIFSQPFNITLDFETVPLSRKARIASS